MPLAAKIIYSNGSNSLTLTFHRLLFSAPLLYVLFRRKTNESIKLNKAELRNMIILSIGYVSTPMLLLSSYNFTSSGTATTIHFIYPVLVLIGCAIFFKEKINRIRGISCILCMVGLITFYTPGDDMGFVGIILALLSGITYSFYIIYFSKSGLQHMNTFKVAFYLSSIGSLEVLVISIITKTLTFNLNALALALSIFFAFATSGIATLLFQAGTRIVGPQKASLLSTFEPLTSVIVGVMLLNENLSFISTIGIVCILVSVVLLGVYDR